MDKETFKKTQHDIYTPTGWQFFDVITVILHLLVIVILGSPLLVLAIFLRV
jgi:hypothetical protein